MELLNANRQRLKQIKDAILIREGPRAARTNYSLLEGVLAKGQTLPIPRVGGKVDRPTVLGFADDAPLENWAHPCRYFLHDAETGELYREIAAQFPLFAREPIDAYKVFYEPVVQPTFNFSHAKRVELPVRPAPLGWGQRYALLFAGMSNNRHTNDLEYLYRTLRDVYHVPANHIRVLQYDGTLNYDGDPQPAKKWPGDNTAYRMTVDGDGSKSKLLTELDRMKKVLKPEDTFLIHTNNHGGHDGKESYLCCYPNWDSLGAKEFADKLAELPKFRCLITMMEQCHSGGFNNPIIKKSPAARTSVASACEELKSSIGGKDFDPFARDWIAALAGRDPFGAPLHHDPDTDKDGRICAREAFDYADSVHDPYDTPVFNETSGGGGCAFGQSLRIPLPRISLLDPLIRKTWPEPDPVLFDKRLAKVLPQLEALAKEFEPKAAALMTEYEQRAAEIIKAAKKE